MKKLSLLLVVLLLSVALIGCSQPEEETPTADPAWTISIVGVEAEPIDFTDLDTAELSQKDVEAVKKKKDGTEITENWQGVPLKEVLAAVGAADYQSVTVEASDGYAQEYTLEIINREETILGLVRDGEKLDEADGPVQMVPAGESGNMYIKNLAKITVQ
ncbi:MAG TPA: molybdopterin-dependent oxidoreductase [Oscillospiraceae bacterium]|nr:molybdopterin-dependent oxidoreductase [Oscillospiraceae bacterium]